MKTENDLIKILSFLFSSIIIQPKKRCELNKNKTQHKQTRDWKHKA